MNTDRLTLTVQDFLQTSAHYLGTYNSELATSEADSALESDTLTKVSSTRQNVAA